MGTDYMPASMTGLKESAMKKLIPTLCLCCLPGIVQANEKPYLDIGASMTEYDSDGLPDVAELENFRVKAGTHFSRYLGLEVHLLFGASGDDLTSSGVEYDVDTDLIYGFLGRVQYPIQRANVYFLGGYSYGEFSAESNNSAFSNQTGRESSLSYGFGADYKIYKKIHFNVDYMLYFSDDNFDFSGVSAGVRWVIGR